MHILQSSYSSISLTIFRIIKQEGVSSSELLSYASRSELMAWRLILLWYKFSFEKHNSRMYWTYTYFYRTDIRIVGSNHILGVDIYLPFSYVMLFCVGTSLATGR